VIDAMKPNLFRRFFLVALLLPTLAAIPVRVQAADAPSAPPGIAADMDDPFASEVISYVAGTGVGIDPISGEPYNDPSRALGPPTVDTTGDGFDIPADEVVPVVQVYSAFRAFELVTIGADGSLVLRFDHPVENHPRNPYGIDFTIFGNASVIIDWQNPWLNGDPNATTIGDLGGFIEPGTVSVSQDAIAWHTFSTDQGPHADPESPYFLTDGPFADVFAPTLGRIYDPEHPDPGLGGWNLWWSFPTDPTAPLDPRLTWDHLYGRTVAEAAILYEHCAGGTGFDLNWLEGADLDWIQYVRITAPSAGAKPEIDAVADVFPHLGDCDADGDVDLTDLASFQRCFTGEDGVRALRTCYCVDFDADLAAEPPDVDVDLEDFLRFAGFLTGPSS
jgi:hypothetical protein